MIMEYRDAFASRCFIRHETLACEFRNGSINAFAQPGQFSKLFRRDFSTGCDNVGEHTLSFRT